MSLWSTPSSALETFGFRKHISATPGAWPVIKLEGSRITTIGLALWSLYLCGYLEAMDVVLACTGWNAIIDGLVLKYDGMPGKGRGRLLFGGCVALWGAAGVTTGRLF